MFVSSTNVKTGPKKVLRKSASTLQLLMKFPRDIFYGIIKVFYIIKDHSPGMPITYIETLHK